MRNTTAYQRSDVLEGFAFSDESDRKLRPALVLSSCAYNPERKEAVVAAITSNVRRHLFGDHLIVDWKGAGLLCPSVATGILGTVRREMVDRKLGAMAKVDPDAVDNRLR